MRYLRDHWRGHHSLARSFWLNGLAANLAAVVVLVAMTLVIAGPARNSPPAMLAGLVGMWAVALLVTVWQVVGTWRSAVRHVQEGQGSRLWARAAQLVLVGLVAQGAVALYDGSRQIGHMARLALGIDGLWTKVARGHDSTTVTVTGFITFATPDRLDELMAEGGPPRRIRFDSPGGYVGPAKTLRETIERLGLDTEAAGRCESACTLAYVGGAARLTQPGTSFGFHGFTLPGVSRADIAAEENLVKASWRERGIAPGFVDQAFAAAGPAMWKPSLAELVAAKFVTGVVVDGRVVDAEAYCGNHDCH
jgi:hypothetical protein